MSKIQTASFPIGASSSAAAARYCIRLLLLLEVVGAGGCERSSRGNGNKELGTESPTLVDPDVAIATICRDSATQSETGRYVFAVMNDMIRRCPDIAATLHFDSVNTCDQAQGFSAAWATYEESHPGNECQPPFDYKLVDHVEEHPSALVGYPIVNSDYPNSPNPTVGLLITRWVAGSEVRVTAYCTGNTIAKNYILTAAHCDSEHYSSVLPRPASSAYTWWRIRWATSDKDNNYVHELSFNALETMHTTYDLMLIYLPTFNSYDRFLPPNVSNYGDYLDKGPSAYGDAVSFWAAGWGKMDFNLQIAAISSIDIVSGPWDPVEYYNVATKNGAQICGGDSGGPLFRLSDDSRYVVAGVLHGGPNDDPATKCGSTNQVYTRVDRPFVTEWIEGVMGTDSGNNVPYRGFEEKSDNTYCWGTTVDIEGTPTSAYKCWGDSCGGPGGIACPGGMDAVCVGDATDFAQNSCGKDICGNGGDCSCLVGQCIFVDPSESPGAGTPTGP